ncbi:MAG: hypothetical protein ABIO94_05485 [Opitutaceae bacterium]
MKRLIAAVLIYVVTVQAALACSCLFTPPAERRQQSSLVFIGRVVAIREQGESRWYDFEITEVFKGPTAAKTVVKSSGDSAMCGASFKNGVIYLVYADGATDQLSTNLCKGNREVASADAKAEIEVLRGQK